MAGIGSLFKALAVLWKHGDALVPLFEQLPALLPLAGQAMAASGDQAINAGKTLRSQGGYPVNAEGLADDLAVVFLNAKTALDDATIKITEAADLIKAVTIPTFTPTFISVPNGFGGSVSVMTGLGLGSASPFGALHDKIDDAVEFIETASEQLDGANTNLTEFSDLLADTGSKLRSLGMALKEAGLAFQQIQA